MLLKTIRIILVIVFVLALLGAGAVAVYQYTHVDVMPPVFTMDYDLVEVSAGADTAALCAGLHAYDNVDGDLSDQIRVQSISTLFNATDATITYLVFDEASNSATCTRTVRYTDYRRPHFALSQPLVYGIGDRITLLDRLTASDVIDGDISSRILLQQNSVRNTEAASYRITVQVTNSAGDTAILPLTLTVQSMTASTPTLRLTDYLIYVNQGDEVDWGSYVASVRDPLGGSDRSKVRWNAEDVSLDTPGTYEVPYFYEGRDGTASVLLTVVVE